MINQTRPWTKYLTNSKELNSKFPNGGLLLDGLYLMKFEYLPGNRVSLRFLQERTPTSIPPRWTQKPMAGLELVLNVGVKSLKADICKEFEDMPQMSVSFKQDEICVQSQSSEEFKISVTTFFMSLDVKPMETLEQL